MLGRLVAERVEAGTAPAELWSAELRELARSLDLVVANLECCLSERGTRTVRIAGKPFFFRGPPSAVEALEAMGVQVATLANNHGLDFEDEALADTVRHLERAGIATAGAGDSPEAARRHAVAETRDGVRLAVVAVTDHPAEYAATPGGWGTAYAPLQRRPPVWLLDEVAEARRRADLVLAFPHWGPNMATEPAKWQRAAAAALLDAGADAVAGHSAHVFHGVEWLAGRPVLYDLGDALDDYRVDPELRNDLGILAIWQPGAQQTEALELVGLRLKLAFTGIATGEDAEWIARRLTSACAKLGTRVERRDEARFAVLPR